MALTVAPLGVWLTEAERFGASRSWSLVPPWWCMPETDSLCGPVFDAEALCSILA